MSHRHPSRTALKIARFLVLIDSVPRLRGLLPPETASTAEKLLLASGVVRPRLVEVMRSPRTLRLYEWVERVVGQGQLIWFGLRKRWMSDSVEAAIRDGATQVLVVGAGFDPLAALTARRHPEVLCVEVDAPATAGPKATGIEQAGLSRPNHVICAADLSQRPLAEALRSTPWNRQARSVVVAEGLLMYLRPEDVTAFFAAVRESSGAGTRVAFSSVDADEQGRPHLRALDRSIRIALRLIGEPMHWGLRREDAAGFLSQQGYRVVEQPADETLRSRYLAPLGLQQEPVLPYEHLVLAETN